MNDLREKIIEALRELDDSEIVTLWNEYCDVHNYPDDRIYCMEELDELYSSAEEAIRRAFYGYDDCGTDNHGESFNPNRNHFYYNGYGNLVSVEYASYNDYANRYMCSLIDEDALANLVIEDGETCGISSLDEILEENQNNDDDEACD